MPNAELDFNELSLREQESSVRHATVAFLQELTRVLEKLAPLLDAVLIAVEADKQD